MSDQLKTIREELSFVRHDLQKVRERTTTLEGRVSLVEDDLNPFKWEIITVREQKINYDKKMDDMENRMQRKKVRIVGLPERSEGLDPVAFLEKWFKDLFGEDTFSTFFTLERAHRVPFRPPPPGCPPRSLLVKMLYYKDRVTILNKAREMGNILYNGTSVSIYPDFSPDLQKWRSRFGEIKRKLQHLKVTYALLYPARLRVTTLGEILSFDTPEGVVGWLATHKGRL